MVTEGAPEGEDGEGPRGVTHGNSSYQSGCRCQTCRDAHSLYMNRYRRKREANGGKITERGVRGGHLFLESQLTARQIADLRKQLTVRFIARQCGISTRTVREVQLQLRERVHPRVALAVDALWAEFCSDPVRLGKLPMAPLKSLARLRYPPPDGPLDIRIGLKHLLSEAERRALYRSQTISVERAEELCKKLGLYPEEVWGPEWLMEVGEMTA